CSARRAREVPRYGPRLGVPGDLRCALPDDVQVPPVVLAVCDRRAAPLRARPRQHSRRLAAPPLSPVGARRRRPRRGPEALRVIVAANPLTPLEHALRAVLDWLGPHGTIGLPWGWSIVALTILVRVVLVPLTVKQIHSMQALQAHAPQMKEIQRKYKGDRQRQNEELMKFYKENNINPAASCLPMLAQIPVFFALYFVLRHFHPGQHDNLSWLGLVDITAKASTGWGPL